MLSGSMVLLCEREAHIETGRWKVRQGKRGERDDDGGKGFNEVWCTVLREITSLNGTGIDTGRG